MSLTVTCPACSAKLRVPEVAAGKTLKCGRCFARFAIPSVATTVQKSAGGEAPKPAGKPRQTPIWMIASGAVGAALLLASCGCGGILLFLNNVHAVQKSEDAAFPPSEMSLTAYLATRPEKPVRFKTVAKLDHGYYGAFRDCADTHWCVLLRQQDSDSSEYVHGFLPKESPDGKNLYSLLKDGQEHLAEVTLESTSPDGQHIGPDGGSTATITRFAAHP